MGIVVDPGAVLVLVAALLVLGGALALHVLNGRVLLLTAQVAAHTHPHSHPDLVHDHPYARGAHSHPDLVHPHPYARATHDHPLPEHSHPCEDHDHPHEHDYGSIDPARPVGGVIHGHLHRYDVMRADGKWRCGVCGEVKPTEAGRG